MIRTAEATAGLARSWHHALQEAPCDRVARWEHGTVVQTRLHPDFYFHNCVRVEGDVSLSANELVGLANDALGQTCHMITFDSAEPAERLAAPMAAVGWRGSPIVLLRHEAPVPPAPPDALTVREVNYDDVHALRARWHREDFPDYDPAAYLQSKRAVDRARGTTVLAALVDDAPAGFAELVRTPDGAEITRVYAAPEHRGRGLGTALTREAIERGSRAPNLWIGAEQGERPELLYRKLGFRPAWASFEFLLVT